MKKFIFFLCIVCLIATVEAQEFIPLWEKGKMPNSPGTESARQYSQRTNLPGRNSGSYLFETSRPENKGPPSSSFRAEDTPGWPTRSADSNWPSGSTQWGSRPLFYNIASLNRPMSKHVTRLLCKIYNVPCATYAPMPSAGV